MKSKKMRPLSNKVSKKSTISRQKWWFGILLIVLFIGYLVWKNSLPEHNTTAVESLPATTEQPDAVPSTSTATSLDNVVNDDVLDDSQAIAAVTDTEAPDPEDILKAPLPKTNSLAKEEIDRLEDERQRLAAQEKLAAEQIAMTKQLTELKAQEIALLEQQIAQLEADTAAKTNTN
ncbi:hypothetical protein [Psychrobacter glacincola]|uniref:hypothetical protein n=1 Tax=Psychrobacter glacincola TaxID=56810 RepID=UPI003BB6317C|tara:strand:- start:3268 stop:3795 length:528 start_codon:yes stop_codon:yes gene_type:complete